MEAEVKHFKVAIIGAGFSGLGMAINLQKAGENDFIVFEREPRVGDMVGEPVSRLRLRCGLSPLFVLLRALSGLVPDVLVAAGDSRLSRALR